MIKKIKIELIFFSLLLLVLAFLQHSDLLHSPLERINLMVEQGNYLHPLLWTFAVYIIIGLIRLIIKYLLYIKNRNKTN